MQSQEDIGALSSGPNAVLLDDGTVVMAQAVLPVWGRQLDVIHEQLNAGISEITVALAALDGLHEELAALGRQEPQALRDGLGQLLPQIQEQSMHALSGLQIGDRLSQMLTVVRGDIQRLVDEMPLLGLAGQQRAEEWLAELKTRYTTPEQHRVHGADPTAGADAAGIDFF
ncbi:hypothetical protein [Inhella gelatinilytica]|uniref:Chemotaxis protein n=1 Tax=Inhella gelatinilytica TaxID=2795030 RepID=A0A931IWY4_9BURK|nr:hypothetical protein [Inhella gelatinilytica]MBH9552163.1 hypothetical protein [Inhella gelatinilytica]